MKIKTIEVVAGILINKNKILCMQRKKNKYDYISYKFEFPGGKIEKGETNEEALIREIKEEMDLDLRAQKKDLFMTIHHTYPDFKIIMHSYLCYINDKKFQTKEHKKGIWSTREQLLTLDWASADLPIVKKLIETKI